MMGVFNNLVMYDQHVAQNSLQSIVPDLATGWSWSEDGTRADLPFAPGRQMARRQAVHRQRRQMHLGPADRQGEREAAPQSAQVLVQQPRRGHRQRRPRGDFRSEAAAAGADRAARLGLCAGLSVSRVAARHAHAPDRHRPVQICRVQAERTDQGRRATPITGRRAGPISTASNTRSSRTARRRSSPSSPASST